MTEDVNIWRLDLPAVGAAASSTPVLFNPSTLREANPQLSQDGQRVVFHSTRSGSNQIWTADLAGGAPQKLTSMDAPEASARHDGRPMANGSRSTQTSMVSRTSTPFRPPGDGSAG
jgi:Tol biopolymer transport system component